MISLETLKAERETLKKHLADIDAESKEIEGKMRAVRQKEIQTKRELEALTVLIELQESDAHDKDKAK